MFSSEIAGLLEKMFIMHDEHMILEMPDIRSI